MISVLYEIIPIPCQMTTGTAPLATKTPKIRIAETNTTFTSAILRSYDFGRRQCTRFILKHIYFTYCQSLNKEETHIFYEIYNIKLFLFKAIILIYKED